jgi:hypothetical protein
MPPRPEKAYVYKMTLRTTYGLTDAMIAQLAPPDKQVPNPHYRSGPPSSLYLIARVESWIDAHQAEVDAARARRAAHSSRMTAQAAERRRQLLAWAETVPVVVEPLPEDIWRQAHYYYASWERWDGGAVGIGGVLAFLRHQYTDYHTLLAQLEGKPGADAAYLIVKRRVMQAAAEALHALMSTKEID